MVSSPKQSLAKEQSDFTASWDLAFSRQLADDLEIEKWRPKMIGDRRLNDWMTIDDQAMFFYNEFSQDMLSQLIAWEKASTLPTL